MSTLKDTVKDYVSKIAYGRSLETQMKIYEAAWQASLEAENESELIQKILDISREYNNK